MNWIASHQPPPRPGDTRTRTRFAWWPQVVWTDGTKRQYVWLERYEVTEEFCCFCEIPGAGHVGPCRNEWLETGRRLLEKPTTMQVFKDVAAGRVTPEQGAELLGPGEYRIGNTTYSTPLMDLKPEERRQRMELTTKRLDEHARLAARTEEET